MFEVLASLQMVAGKDLEQQKFHFEGGVAWLPVLQVGCDRYLSFEVRDRWNLQVQEMIAGAALPLKRTNSF